jgi:hypothetical protein
MALKPWHTVITPREDLIEGRPLDASEFAVHLDHVRTGVASADYVDPERFFSRTYLTQNLLEIAAQTVRRLSGITTETSPVFNLTTQFGGGKTHSLTALYHLATCGKKAKKFVGVDRILEKAGVSEIPSAIPVIFVGTEFGSITGRGGNGEPLRKTPWGEIAFQVGGAKGFELLREHDEKFIAPAGDDLNKLFDPKQPYLILFDELLNYVSKHRKYNDLGAQFYNFVHTLTEFVRSRDNIVFAVAIPASELEMTEEDHQDYERFKKMLDRLGKAMFMAKEKETTEIIRRRLFDWHGMPDEGKKTIAQYISWIQEHKAEIPGSFSIDTAREQFEASYPFHPTVLTVFERKWQTLPKFQQTRAVLRLLALWISNAYSEGYKKVLKDPLISMGTAPLEDSNFRAAIFSQLGEDRLEAAVTSDIAGKDGAIAERLDREAIEAIKKSRLHRKCATIIFFESNGGQTRDMATLPEIKLAVGEPDVDIGLVDGVLTSLVDQGFYLSAAGNKYKLSHSPTINKIYSDRRAGIDDPSIDDLVETEVKKVFEKGNGIDRIFFPEKNIQVADRPILSLVIMHPSRRLKDKETTALMEDVIRNYGQSARAFKSGLIFCVAEEEQTLREEARKFLAWDTICDEADDLQLEDDQRKIAVQNRERAKRDLTSNIWRTYHTLVFLDKNNQLTDKPLGLLHGSEAKSLIELYINRLTLDGEITDEVTPNFLMRNWSPAFKEWSIRNVRDAFYASPQFPRLLNPESIKNTIAKGVSNKIIAYVGKRGSKYDPFEFEKTIGALDIEISDEMYIITAEEARKHVEPRRLTSLKIFPPEARVEPGKNFSFAAKGFDQHSDEFIIGKVEWSASTGSINEQGILIAPETEGVCKVTAKSNGTNASATVTITKKVQGAGNTPIPGAAGTQKKIAWSNSIPLLKWNVFYTRVLSKFSSNPKFKVTIQFELEDESLTDEKIQETKTALKEMGLDDNI